MSRIVSIIFVFTFLSAFKKSKSKGKKLVPCIYISQQIKNERNYNITESSNTQIKNERNYNITESSNNRH